MQNIDHENDAPNPFSGVGKYVLGSRLVGRKQETKAILKDISAGTSVSLVGEHRIGKTSVARCVFNECLKNCKTKKEKKLFLFISLSSYKSQEEFFFRVFDELRRQVREADFLSSECERFLVSYAGEEAYFSLLRLLRGCLKKMYHYETTFFIDEFDAVANMNDQEQGRILIQRLRELINNGEETGLSCVFISRRSLLHIESSTGFVSNLCGVCVSRFLKPLSLEGIREMLERCRPSWNVGNVGLFRLIFYTGGNPFLAEMILYHAWEEKNIASGVEHCRRSLYEYLHKTVSLLKEDDLFSVLLQHTSGLILANDFDSEKFLRLVDYGILKKRENRSPNVYRTYSCFFQRYLAMMERSTPIWDIWTSCENHLRDIVDFVLKNICKGNWEDQTDTIFQHKKNLLEVFHEVQYRKNREFANFGYNPNVRILDYLYPVNLWEIIIDKWNDFAIFFAENKEYWNKRFAFFQQIRAPLAHVRPYIVRNEATIQLKKYADEVAMVHKKVFG